MDSNEPDGLLAASTGEVDDTGGWWLHSLGRMARNGAAVLAAILIAFGLDAWWTDRDEDQRIGELLLSIADEFEAATTQLDSILSTNDRYVARSIAFLARTEPGLPPPLLDSVAQYSDIFDEPFQTYDPAFGALNTLIYSGGLERVGDVDLQQALGGWEGELREHDFEVQQISLTLRRILETASAAGVTSTVVLRSATGSQGDSEIWLRLAADDDFRQALAEMVLLLTEYGEELARTRDRGALLASRLGS